MAMASGLLIALGWGTVTSYAYLTRDQVIEGKNKTISTMSSQYKTLSSDFSALEAEVERRAQQLEERQRFLEEMLDVGATVTSANHSDTAEADAGKTASPEADTPQDVETAAPEPQAEPQAEPQPEQRSEQQSSVLNTLFFGPSAHATVVSNVERRSLLLDRLRDLEERQRDIADKLLSDVDEQIVFVDATLSETDLSIDRLLEKAAPATVAVGGPYVPEHDFNGVFDATDGTAFLALKESSERLKMVTNALDSYPLGKPAANYYVSSRFGRRRDPIKKTWAKHSGLDLAGWPGTAITATAPGKVVYSGWYGPYGNMVEIDHGNGFRTRYGHMKKLRVKKNEQVILGQRLGDMGRTGRATDTHVHYEVWFDDKVRDPMPYMKAAQNVLKIQGRHEKTSK